MGDVGKTAPSNIYRPEAADFLLGNFFGIDPNNVPCIPKAICGLQILHLVTDAISSRCRVRSQRKRCVFPLQKSRTRASQPHHSSRFLATSDGFHPHLVYLIDLLSIKWAPISLTEREEWGACSKKALIEQNLRTACDYRAFTAFGNFGAQPSSSENCWRSMLRCGLCYSAIGCACTCLQSV